MQCDMNCLQCKFSDCVNDSDVLSTFEREVSKETDKSILDSRGITYDPTGHKRQLKDVDPVLYKQAQNKHFHKKYYNANPEHFREKGRENYRKHKEAHLARSRQYNAEHKEEISANKKTYYQEHREEILAKRKAKYIPKGKRPVIDTPEAEVKRQCERERYEKNKEEINRKRRERRRQKNEYCENQ